MKRWMARVAPAMRTPLPTLLCALACATPVAAQGGAAGRAGAPADTAGAGGPPSLRALVEQAREASDLRVLRQRFHADRAALGRRYDVPLSPVLHARLRAFYTGWQSRLQQLNGRTLNDAGRTDLTELRRRIRAGLDTVAAEERQFAEFAPLLPFARTIQLLQERRRDRLDVDPLHAAETLDDMRQEVERLSAAIRGAGAGVRPPELRAITADVASRALRFLGTSAVADTAARRSAAAPSTATLRTTLDSWYSFYYGYDPLFSWWVRKPYEELVAALDAYARAIQREWTLATQPE